MSTSPNTPSFAGLNARPASPANQASPAWLREPLLHFLVLGALLFAVDHVLVGRSDDPRKIVVGAAVDAEAKQVFAAARGREPNEQELKALRQVWLDNEVLYREGLALQVDRGDSAIRERVIFKALSVLDANTKLPAVDDKMLRAWFEKNRAKYDEPARFDFQEAALSGDNSEAAVRAFVTELNGGTPGDAKAGLRVFKGRPHSNIVQSYGPEFAKALEALPPGEWRALSTREGWRAMRLEAISPAKPANFEALRGVVLPDWTDATMAEQRSAAVRALTKKYKVIESGEASKP
ncbi:peptidylprolyl isomerase [Roseateles albus]|uniref:Peptidylprolyl isomerase n=1 Tax=Roseateles albus TaxID=2987525 RepID=A0ABT5K8V6_9BURK|nr:peptidylprolyl isomerase [Roseateles albus]MDC8770362.1 peptidylprolyl isomerase [Roseateles albus]